LPQQAGVIKAAASLASAAAAAAAAPAAATPTIAPARPFAAKWHRYAACVLEDGIDCAAAGKHHPKQALMEDGRQ
jgi:hypothetical protein